MHSEKNEFYSDGVQPTSKPACYLIMMCNHLIRPGNKKKLGTVIREREREVDREQSGEMKGKR